MTRHQLFVQECPICGRPLEIAREFQGQKVICGHCGGRFMAINPAHHGISGWNQSNRLLQKADHLLETCASSSAPEYY